MFIILFVLFVGIPLLKEWKIGVIEKNADEGDMILTGLQMD